MGFKDKVKNNPKKYSLVFSIYNRLFGGNKIKIKGNSKVILNSCLLKKCRIEVYGDGNIVNIKELTQADNTFIFVKGNNCSIEVAAENGFNQSSLWVEDDNSRIVIGKHNRFFKDSHVAATEGKTITIGEDGLFAPQTQIRTGDSHSILDKEGNRTNQAKDVTIGNHVWLADGVLVLKGSEILDNTVVAARSLVNKKLAEGNAVYGGSPAKLLKSEINWNTNRL